MTEGSFLDAVAEKCGHPVEAIASLLAASRVPTADTVGAPHRLRVTRLRFSGQKAGMLTDAIEFDQEFSDGLWGICSSKNDAGKTSILEIMMWALRGAPKRLQDDVRTWLNFVRLEGTVDGVPFDVNFQLDNGFPTGALTCEGDVRPFASEAAFSDTMSQFMMERLGFQSFSLWVEGQGMATHHWPSYSTVLYLPRETNGAIIGDRAGDGVAQRLVQLFVGIRWAQTTSMCQAALRQAEAEETKREADLQAQQQTVRSLAAGSLGTKRTELALTRVRLEALPTGLPTDEVIEAARADWLALITQQGHLNDRFRVAQGNALHAKTQVDRERRRLTNITEAALARRLFHGLNPSRCPRCSTDIGADRKKDERENHACAVCFRELDLDLDAEIDETPISADDADEMQSADDLRRLVDDLDLASSTENRLAEAIAEEVARLSSRVSSAEARVKMYADLTEQVGQRRLLATRVAALEAVVAELENLTTDESAQQLLPEPQDLARLEILRAATTEALRRRSGGFAEVVEAVNAAILSLALRFGFATLQEVKLGLGAQLKLVKGGASTSFSKQTPGEKLRLRIAVVVALLRVAHDLHVGRHPGLLLIDSIGAEETEPGDLGQFLSELGSICSELRIQIFVASARPEVPQYIPEGHLVQAKPDGYMW